MTNIEKDDVMENPYSSVNIPPDTDYATVSTKNVELNDMTDNKADEKETNGVNSHSNKATVSKPKSTADTGGVKPFLPKIFIALLIVLLIAVIALSFILYHLDQEVGKTKNKVATVDGVPKSIKGLTDELKSLEKQFGGFHDGEHWRANITDLNNAIDKVEEFAKQLQIVVDNGREPFSKLGMDVKALFNLLSLDDKVISGVPILQQLLKQSDDFKKIYNTKWNIDYKDVMALIGPSDFKDKDGPKLLGKINILCKTYEKEYRNLWGIEFKEVFRFTTKADMQAIKVKYEGAVQTNAIEIPVLAKLDYMFRKFTELNKNWHMHFKDVIAMTKTLVEVGGTPIPILAKIDSWYVTNFQEVWGDTFDKFVHMKISDEKRAAYVAKMKKISEDMKLKFHPAKIELVNGALSFSGFIEILYEEIFGTISHKYGFSDKLAGLVCQYGGYESGVYGDGKYNRGDKNRTSIDCGIEEVVCSSRDTALTKCNVRMHDVNKTCLHEDDVGVKCTVTI